MPLSLLLLLPFLLLLRLLWMLLPLVVWLPMRRSLALFLHEVLLLLLLLFPSPARGASFGAERKAEHPPRAVTQGPPELLPDLPHTVPAVPAPAAAGMESREVPL